jgi:hypothetical protein
MKFSGLNKQQYDWTQIPANSQGMQRQGWADGQAAAAPTRRLLLDSAVNDSTTHSATVPDPPPSSSTSIPLPSEMSYDEALRLEDASSVRWWPMWTQKTPISVLLQTAMEWAAGRQRGEHE